MQIEEKDYNKAFDWRIWAKLWKFIKPFRGLLFTALIFNIFCAMVDIALPLFQQYAINHFIGEMTTEGMPGFALTYLAAIIFQMASVMVFCRCAMVIEMRMSKDMKKACFDHLQELSFSYYNTTPVGYILARVMSDTGRISGLIAWNFLDMFWALFYVIGIFAVMARLNLKLALFVMLVVPALVFLTFFFQKRILAWNRQVRKHNSRITGAYNEGIMGAQTSKTLVIEKKNAEQFHTITQEMRIAGIKASRMNGIYISLVVLCSAVATAIILRQGGMMVEENVILIGTLSAFTTYAVNMFEPIQNVARNLSELMSAQANTERVMGLLDEEAQIQDRPDVIEKYGTAFDQKRENWEPIKGDIVFEDVTFHYPDGNENILEHFNLHVPAGTTVAIVGETGAGKSTLVNLACRFFEPTEGRILIDGVDYRERSQAWLHSSIGYVLQSPHLFTGTIMENIRYGRLEATDEEVIRAAKTVSADKVASKLEKGWKTDVGEGGDSMSTGEKQLISFARAVLADPAIFVLDEATSSIDTETEQLIQNAISYLLKDRTSFIIAHRLSTIRQADIILVVKAGKIIEQGSHRELMEKRGYYYNLYTQQFREEMMEGFTGAKKTEA
ncbi:MAG: ABC transporter ATP-binding protein [Lachnospiraceae bacterium]|nr:ABC transporter ATP-binding protein [Lachnospiraceae bacterium]